MKYHLLIVAGLLAFSASSQVTHGLVTHYSFNGGNANDEVGTLHGIAVGALLDTGRCGNPNTAYYFDGINDYIDFGNTDPIGTSSSMTLCVSYRPLTSFSPSDTVSPNPSNNQYIFSTGGQTSSHGYALLWSKGSIQALRRTATHLSNTGLVPYVDNNWQYSCFTYDDVNKQMKMYNNQLLEEDTQSIISASSNTFQDVYAGKPNSINAFYFHGLIDDIRIYNRVLDSLELDSLYQLVYPVCIKRDTISPISCGPYLSPSGKTWVTSGLYYDTLINPNSCVCDQFYTISLTVHEPSFDTLNTSICQGDSVFIAGAYRTTSGAYADSLKAVGGCDSILTTILAISPTYWLASDTALCDHDSILIFETYRKNAGWYYDSIQTADGCDSVIAVYLDKSFPNIAVYQQGASLTSQQNSATYQWLDCDSGYSTIQGATLQGYLAVKNGSYAVEVTINGCSDTSNCYLVNTIGIDERGASTIRVYPNPTKGTVLVDFGNIQKLAVVVLTNIQGQALNTWEFKGTSTAVLKLEEVPGMYFLQVNLKEERIVLPVVVD